MSDTSIEKKKFKFLRKGEGKLASDYHGQTKFAKKRLEKIIKEQEQREIIKEQQQQEMMMNFFSSPLNSDIQNI